MDTPTAYKDFTTRLKLLVSKHPNLIATTLSNIFTMRLIGNKTHGDVAEIAMAEFINQHMYDFRSIHVGKDLYRAKSREEDITIINEITQAEFPVSLKAYGDGPLQLSTDKNFLMFPRLEQEGGNIHGAGNVKRVFDDPVFTEFSNINVLPLIYDESRRCCNILVFDYARAREATSRIVRVAEEESIRCTDSMIPMTITYVRYGTGKNRCFGLIARKYFDSITDGWIDYSHNHVLVSACISFFRCRTWIGT